MGSFSSYYDPASEQVFISVTLPDKSYAGWGWGSSMTNTEMIIFSADGQQSTAKTYYSKGEQDPELEDSLQSCYKTTKQVDADAGTVTITASRPLDCGVKDSYVIQPDTQLNLISAWDTTSPEMKYHGDNIKTF